MGVVSGNYFTVILSVPLAIDQILFVRNLLTTGRNRNMQYDRKTLVLLERKVSQEPLEASTITVSIKSYLKALRTPSYC